MWVAFLLIVGILGSVGGVILLISAIVQNNKVRIIAGSAISFFSIICFLFGIYSAISNYFTLMGHMISEAHCDSYMRDNLMNPDSLMALGDESEGAIYYQDQYYSMVFSGFAEKAGSNYYYTSLYFPNYDSDRAGITTNKPSISKLSIEDHQMLIVCDSIPSALKSNVEALVFYSKDSLLCKGKGFFTPANEGYRGAFQLSLPKTEYIDHIIIKAAE